MATLSLEQKKQAIEKFIADNQKGYVLYKSVQKNFPECAARTLDDWVKSIYGEKPSEFFKKRGVIISWEKDGEKWCTNMINRLKKVYQNKKPAPNKAKLIEDNPEMPIEDLCNILDSDFLCRLAWNLYEYGILENPVGTDQKVKDWIESSNLYRNGSTKRPALSLHDIREDLDGYHGWDRMLVNSRFERFPSIYGCTAEEFFQEKGLLLSPEKAKAEAEKHLKILAQIYSDPKQRKTEPTAVFYGNKKYVYTTFELYYYYMQEAEKLGMNEDEACDYVKQVYIDAGVLNGKMSQAAIEKKAKQESKKSKKAASSGSAPKTITYTYTNLYDDMGKIDVKALCDAAGYDASKVYPADKKFTVNSGGKDFYVQLGLKRTIKRLDGWRASRAFDARKEFDTMLTREQVIDQIYEEDPNSDGADYATAQFQFLHENRLSKDEMDHRRLFLKVVGVCLRKPDILQALVDYVPKKKNGTFNRNGYVRIASSMVTADRNIVYEILGQAKEDDTVYISFCEAKVDPSNLEKSKKDFVSACWELFEK